VLALQQTLGHQQRQRLAQRAQATPCSRASAASAGSAVPGTHSPCVMRARRLAASQP
jgi:hypothetical protein